MKELLRYSNKYVEQMDVKDVGLLKVCLCSLGILVGLVIPKRYKTKVAKVAGIAYVCTYAPLITKFLKVVVEESKPKASK